MKPWQQVYREETVCPVTGDQVTDTQQCRACTIGRAYLCPVKQEIEAMDAWQR